MSSKGMEGFKKQLKALKEKGADIDPEKIIKDLITPAPDQAVEIFEESFDKKAFDLCKEQVNKLFDDYENHYGPKGRGISIAIHIQKENCADKYAETFNYIPEKISIVHVVDIGTKGKYEPIVLLDEGMIEEQRKKVKERDEKRKE